MRIKNRKLHFVFEDKELNREDVLESFVKKIKGKNVTIFGDSLQRIFHQWMAEVLGFNKKVSIQGKQFVIRMEISTFKRGIIQGMTTMQTYT